MREPGLNASGSPSTVARVALVTLRTLIGWHFLYEGYYKLMLPGWTASGMPADRWSAAGYLANATGPFAATFHALAQSTWLPWVDTLIMIALVLIGISLLLGLFTQTGCAAAMLLLGAFYVAMIPLSGSPQPGSEGTYLLINKTLVELGAVWVLLALHTGRIAGLDVLLQTRHTKRRVEADSHDQVHALAGH